MSAKMYSSLSQRRANLNPIDIEADANNTAYSASGLMMAKVALSTYCCKTSASNIFSMVMNSPLKRKRSSKAVLRF